MVAGPDSYSDGTPGDWLGGTARLFLLAAIPLSLASPGVTVAMALLGLCGVIAWARGRALPPDIATAGRITLVLYMLLLIVDLLNGDGLRNLTTTGVNYLPLIALAPVAFGIRLAEIEPEALDRAAQITIVLATLGALFQWLVIGDVGPGNSDTGTGGLALNPIPFGLVVTVWGLQQLVRGLQGGPQAPVAIAAAVLAAVPAFLTLSKLIWSAMALGYGLALVVWAVRHRRWRELALTVALTAAVLGLATVYFAQDELVVFGAEMRDLLRTGAADGLSVGARVELMRSALEAFWQKPWLGHGQANQMQVALSFGYMDRFDFAWQHLHNDYFAHLVSFGVFGAVFLAGFFALWAGVASHCPDPGLRGFGFIMLAVLAFYTVFEIAFSMDPVSGLIPLLLGLLLAARRPLA